MKIGRIDIDWVMASEARPDINELQVRAHYCVYRINKERGRENGEQFEITRGVIDQSG